MHVGGKRKGAGRPKGAKNEKTKERQELINSVVGTSGDPFVLVMEAIANPATPPDIRLKLSLEIMPYVRPKLASIEQREGGKSHEERLAELQSMMPDAVSINGSTT